MAEEIHKFRQVQHDPAYHPLPHKVQGPQEPNVGFTEALGEHVVNPPLPRQDSADVVTAFDQRWPVAPLSQRLKAQFEQHVRGGALDTIQEVDGAGNPEMSRKMMAAYISEKAAGAYNWDGSACRSARGEITGLRHLFYLLLHSAGSVQKDDTATADAVFNNDPKRAILAIQWAVGNSEPPAKPPGAPRAGGNGISRQPQRPITMD